MRLATSWDLLRGNCHGVACCTLSPCLEWLGCWQYDQVIVRIYAHISYNWLRGVLLLLLLLQDEVALIELHLEDRERQCLVIGVDHGLFNLVDFVWFAIICPMVVAKYDLFSALLERDITASLMGRRNYHANIARFLCRERG